MKTLFAVYLASSVIVSAQAAAPLPDHWVREDKKQVHFVPVPDLHVTLTHIGAEEYWSALSIELGFLEKGSGFQELARKYPGYELVRVVIEKDTDFVLQVPGVASSENVEPKSSIEGPIIAASRGIFLITY